MCTKRSLVFACCLAALLAVAIRAFADVAVPPREARVIDLTGTLTEQEQETLEQTLAAFESRKGSQIAVLIVPTTQPETVEQYAVRVIETWKLGRTGMDDSVLLLVAKNDRQLRIQVGHGLARQIPNWAAMRIIDEEIVPRFKQDNFFGGIGAAVSRIIQAVDSESPPAPNKYRNEARLTLRN